MKQVILFILFNWFLVFQSTAQTTYYVDAILGNDADSGTSISSPWQTLTKVSGTSFDPGDVIKFKSGQTFSGILTISSSGSSGSPIVYDSYGSGELPIIDGQGADYAVYCNNKEYVEFKNFQVTNHRTGTITTSDRFNGIYLASNDFGTVDHIHLDNIRIFDVNSSGVKSAAYTLYYGGMLIYAAGSSVPSNFNDLVIENCTFEDLSRTGVNIRSEWLLRDADTNFGDTRDDGSTDNWFPSTNVIFRDNIFRHIWGNGLVVRVSEDALIEGNLFDECAYGISGNATFCFNTDGTIFQYNEAKNTVYNSGDTDARGIDVDYRTKNSIVQYNYLHDNGFGGFVATGGAGRFNLNTIVRYNILENNKQQGMHFSGAIDGMDVYNNVIYANEFENDIVILNFKRWTTWPNNLNFRNNIFYIAGSNPSFVYNDGNSASNGATNVSFSNNLYFGPYPENLPITATSTSLPNVTKDDNYQLSNPLFGSSQTGYFSYSLRDGSPAISDGLTGLGQPATDAYGNPINPSMINIGVYQKAAVADDSTSVTNVYVQEDAYTRSGTYANTNYGSASTIDVKKATGNFTRKGLLKYDFSSIAGSIKKATLRIYASSNTGNSYDNYFYGLDDDSWSEASVTENNRPGSGSNPFFAKFTINSSTSKWYDVDITSFVQQQQQADGVVSLMITDRASSQYLTSIVSKEGSASNKSYVIVEHYNASVSVTRRDVIEDAFTRDGTNASTNYGADADIETKTSSTNFNRKGMLKFDISGLQDIQSATLHFYANTNTGNTFSHNIRGYGNNWSENTITDNNRPAGKSVITAVSFSGTTNKWYSADVTPFVQEQKNNGWSNVSFLFSDDVGSTYLSRITSKEGNNQYAAYLEIESVTSGGSGSRVSTVENQKEETGLTSQFQVYPNPVSSEFSLKKTINSADEIKVSVYNIEGKIIFNFKEDVKEGIWKKTLNRHDIGLKRGVYTIRFQSEANGEFSSRILVF